MIPDLLTATELDRPGLARLAEGMAAYEPDESELVPRSYPGYPSVTLSRVRVRRLASLDHTLLARRSVRTFQAEGPDERAVSRLLRLSHGVTADRGFGPAPSAGGLHALELYLAALSLPWLSPAVYHYDRVAHALARVAPAASRASWTGLVPTLMDMPDAPLVLVIAGGVARVERKYGQRGHRFLLLEAGHLMQNLALVAASLGASVVSCGGTLEGAVARELALPRTDAVLYAAACGLI